MVTFWGIRAPTEEFWENTVQPITPAWWIPPPATLSVGCWLPTTAPFSRVLFLANQGLLTWENYLTLLFKRWALLLQRETNAVVLFMLQSCFGDHAKVRFHMKSHPSQLLPLQLLPSLLFSWEHSPKILTHLISALGFAPREPDLRFLS